MFANIRLYSVFLFLTGTSMTASYAETIMPEDTTQSMHDQLAKNEVRFGIAGQSVKILKNGQTIFNGRQGFANIQLSLPIQDNHKFPVYSVSKLFTNVLAMKLVEEGKLDIEKSIRHYLPFLPESWQSVSVAHAWNHMSGLPEFFNIEVINNGGKTSRLDILKGVEGKPFEYETGAQDRYNQTGYMVLTAIIEKIYGQSHPKLVEDIIFKPLNLSNSGYAGSRKIIDQMVTAYRPTGGELLVNQALDWPTYSYSISALYSTKDDLIKFMSAVYNQYFVKSETLEKLWTPMLKNNGQAGGFAHGWHWGKSDRYNYIGHTGGNVVKLRQYYTDIQNGDTYTIAYLTNGSRSNIYIDILVDGLIGKMNPKEFPLEKLGADLFDVAFSANDSNSLDNLTKTFSTNHAKHMGKLNDFINQRAYTLLFAVDAKSALPLFALNTRLFPNSANAWDSFAEAWMQSGDKGKAIIYYEKALSLDPENTRIKQVLADLNKSTTKPPQE